VAGFAELRELSRQPSWRRWALASTLGRLMATMAVLAYILVGEAIYDSVALGALLAGAATFSAGLAAPLLGRLFDRRGLRVGLVRSLWATATFLTLQLAAVATTGPTWLLFSLAVLQGVSYAAVPGGYRALLVPSVSAPDLERANTVDAVLTELGFVTGPVAAGIAAAVAGPLGAIVLMIIIVVTAALVTGRLDEVQPAEPGALVPWRRPAARVVYAVCFAVGVSIGLLESAVAARVVELGLAAPWSGPILALVALGSGAAGLAVSTLHDQRGRLFLRSLLALGGFTLALGLAAVAPNAILLGVTMVLVGAPIAPLNAMGAQRLQDTLDGRQLGEGFALYSALILIGVGTGDLLTGRLLGEVGPAFLLGIAAVIPTVAALALAVGTARSRFHATRERTLG
jgi:MFS family permease